MNKYQQHRKRQGLTGKIDGMLLDELLGLIRVETGEREHALYSIDIPTIRNMVISLVFNFDLFRFCPSPS
jgi:hypothetical protein